MSIDTIDLAAAEPSWELVRDQLAELVRDAAVLGLHVVLQPATDGGQAARADLLVRHVTDGVTQLAGVPLEDLADGQVLHGAATLRPGDDCHTLRAGHASAYRKVGKNHTPYYPNIPNPRPVG